MTSFWPGPGWLDCHGQEAGDGTVRCTIQVLGGGNREVLVPNEHFDARGRRLKVRVIRPSDPPEGDNMLDCPSMETGSSGLIVEIPIGRRRGRRPGGRARDLG